MKRAPQDLIQNPTAVSWLPFPFCGTSAAQLAPLGDGEGITGFLWGENTARYHQALRYYQCHLLEHHPPLLVTGTVSAHRKTLEIKVQRCLKAELNHPDSPG